jgi:hypothetical protein
VVEQQIDSRMDFHFNAILDIIAEWRKGRELEQDTSLLSKFTETMFNGRVSIFPMCILRDKTFCLVLELKVLLDGVSVSHFPILVFSAKLKEMHQQFLDESQLSFTSVSIVKVLCAFLSIACHLLGITCNCKTPS